MTIERMGTEHEPLFQIAPYAGQDHIMDLWNHRTLCGLTWWPNYSDNLTRIGKNCPTCDTMLYYLLYRS